MIVIKMIILSHIIRCSESSISFYKPAESNKLINCGFKIMKKYFSFGESLSGSVLSININSKNDIVQQLLLELLYDDTDFYWTNLIKNFDKDSLFKINVPEKTKSYLIFINDIDQLIDVLEQLKHLPTWNSLAETLLIYTNLEDGNDIRKRSIAELVDKKFLNHYFININYNENTIESFSYFPYDTNNSCGHEINSIYCVDQCEYNTDTENFEIVQKKESLITDKIPNNLNQCLLKIAARSWEPYTIYDITENEFSGGIDVQIIKTIAEILNMKIEINFENRTLYYIFQDLIDNTIDLIVGGFDEEPAISHLISTSIPYYQDDLTWCLAKSENIIHWTSFLSLFDKSTTIFTILTIILLTSAICGLFAWYKIKTNFLRKLIQIGSVLFSQSPNIYSKYLSIRLILLSIFIFSLIINAAYQSFLISSLTHPRNQFQITKIEEIYQNGIYVTGGIEIVRHLYKQDDTFEYLRQKMTICYNIEKCLKIAIERKILAVAISREHVFYNQKIQRDKLYCFSRTENIYSYLVTILAPKQYHLLKQINNIIQLITESGYIVKWTRDMNSERILKEAMSDRNIIYDNVLTIAQLKGPFTLGLILLVVSTNILLLEILVYSMIEKRKLKNRKNNLIIRFKIWRILHNFFRKL